MWGFSFDEIARRAQVEAAKLAEQAQSTAASMNMQTPGLFNLDSMITDASQQQQPQQQPPASTTAAQQPTSYFFTTPSNADVTSVNNRTAPPAYGQSLNVNGGNADHIPSLVSDVASPRAATTITDTSSTAAAVVGSVEKKKVAVTKLPTTTDDFFDSWGGDDNNAAIDTPTDTINEIKSEEMYNDELRGKESSEQVENVDTCATAAEHADVVTNDEVVQEEEPEQDAWGEDDLDIADADDVLVKEIAVDEAGRPLENDNFAPVETTQTAEEKAQIVIPKTVFAEEQAQNMQIDDSLEETGAEADSWGENDLGIADDSPIDKLDDSVAVEEAQILNETVPAEESEEQQLDVQTEDVLEEEEESDALANNEEADPWTENDFDSAVENDEQKFNEAAVAEESLPSEEVQFHTADDEAALHEEQIESPAEDQWGDDRFDAAVDNDEHPIDETAIDEKLVSASGDNESDGPNEVKVLETEEIEPLLEETNQWDDDEINIVNDYDKHTIDKASDLKEPVSPLNQNQFNASIEETLKQTPLAAKESCEWVDDELDLADADEYQQTDKAATEQEPVSPPEDSAASNKEDTLEFVVTLDEWGKDDLDMNNGNDAQVTVANEVENDLQSNVSPEEGPLPTTEAVSVSDDKASNEGVKTTGSKKADPCVNDDVKHVESHSEIGADTTTMEADVENAPINVGTSQMEEPHGHEKSEENIAMGINDDLDGVADQWAEDDIELAASESNEVVDTEPKHDIIDEKTDSDELCPETHFVNDNATSEEFFPGHYDTAETEEHDQLAGEDILGASNHRSAIDTDIGNQCQTTLTGMDEPNGSGADVLSADNPDMQHHSMDGGAADEISLSQTENCEAPDGVEPNEQQSMNPPSNDNVPTGVDVPAPSTLFDGAQNITAATQSLQSVFGSHASNFFDASKSSAMFSWSFPNIPASNEANVPTENTPSEVVYNTDVSGPSPKVEDIPPQPPVVDEAADASAMDDLYNDDALDDMYDESSEEDGDDEEAYEPQTNDGNPAAAATAEDVKDMADETETRSSPEVVPQHVLDKFIKQLERMTESHQLEMDELQRSHKIQIDNLQNELKVERSEKQKAKDREAVAAQDKLLSQMRELEKNFTKTLQEKEEELEQVMQRNEGNKLKMDSMKREVDGLLRLVDERDDEICRLKQGHGNTMLNLEGNMKVSQEELRRKDAEIRDLKSSVSTLQAETDSTTEAFNTLKSRAKAVATELKDRRVEVRNLTASNEELATANASLETQLANLQALNDQQRLTIGYKDKDIEALNEKVKELNKQIEAKEGLLQDRSSVGEKAISLYKRKAQEALAAANARLAAANQAREEAESDAKAAKTASDDAVERARISETKRAEAERFATEASSLLESERSANSQLVSELEETLHDLNRTIESMRVELVDAASTKETLLSDMERVKADLGEQMEINSELREKLFEEKDLCNSLQKEVHDLRDEVQRSSAAAFKRQKEETLNSENQADSVSANTMIQSSGLANPNGRAEADGTIIMLQQELQGANEAISELKLALRMALLERTESSANGNQQINSGSFAEHDHTTYDSASGNDSTPLFFAIEKQNELNTARDEINRLANMLGDAESEKQDAFDAMNEMRQKMEEANARLLRYEKLGMKSSRPLPTSASTGYASYSGAGHSPLYPDSHNGLRTATLHENDSAVNLEYLKNVMLSYLKAKTLADRRKLVPVIATVLCLTPEEQSQAVLSVEESAGLTGVASSFWENLESKAHNLL